MSRNKDYYNDLSGAHKRYIIEVCQELQKEYPEITIEKMARIVGMNGGTLGEWLKPRSESVKESPVKIF